MCVVSHIFSPWSNKCSWLQYIYMRYIMNIPQESHNCACCIIIRNQTGATEMNSLNPECQLACCSRNRDERREKNHIGIKQGLLWMYSLDIFFSMQIFVSQLRGYAWNIDAAVAPLGSAVPYFYFIVFLIVLPPKSSSAFSFLLWRNLSQQNLDSGFFHDQSNTTWPEKWTDNRSLPVPGERTLQFLRFSLVPFR